MKTYKESVNHNSKECGSSSKKYSHEDFTCYYNSKILT